jgi:hypothetical protein
MRIRNLLLITAAIGGLAVTGLTSQSPLSVISPAKAETNVLVNIDIGTFYDRLGSQGSWVSYEDDYVWVPSDVVDDWRPYTVGNWVYTNKHGWYWDSDEPFGWAVYHYGRWGHTEDIGWYWVPGRKWAPAWVAWSRTDKAVAWAPLPPRRGRGGADVEVSINVDDVPDIYWQAVPVEAFLEDDLSTVIIRERPRVVEIVREGDIRPVVIENNIVINNVIDVDFIEERTNEKVVVREERIVENPDEAGRTDDNSVAIFDADIEVKEGAKPKDVVETDQLKKRRAERTPADQTDQPKAVEGKVQPGAEPGAETVEKPVDEKTGPDTATGTVGDKQQPATKVKPSTADTGTVDEEQPAAGQTKKKAKPTTAETQPTGEEPAAAKKKVETGEDATQPAKERVKKQKANRSEENVEGSTGVVSEPDQSAEQPAKKRKKQPADQQTNKAQPEKMENAAPDAQGGEQPVKKRKQQADDQGAQLAEPPAADAPEATPSEKPKKIKLPEEASGN